MYSKTLITTAAIAFLALGCAKKLDYDTEAKINVLSKSAIDTEAEFIYVPSMAESSRTSSSARPYALGESKTVKFQFVEGALEVRHIDTDARFKDNMANAKSIITIPVTDLEYRCAKDKYGECTNKEELNNDIPWNQRSQFLPLIEQIKINEANLLPLEMERVFGGSSCFTEVKSRPLFFKVEADAINFAVEKTFSVRGENCLKESTSLEELLGNSVVTGVYHYSFVKIKAVASPLYQPVPYPNSDSNAFGFFDTKVKTLDADFSDSVGSEKTYLNRWNPVREKIVYYLSKEFAKPENQALRKATYKGVEKINSALGAAGVRFRIELQDANGKVPGDIRNSFIIMVEDPIASGVLGYGPSTANPKTGEIISARTVMYPGVMRQFIRWTYDQVLQEHNSMAQPQAGYEMSPQLQAQVEAFKAATVIEMGVSKKSSSRPSRPLTDLQLQEIKQELSGKKLIKNNPLNSKKSLISAMSEQCFYPAELYNFNGPVRAALKGELGTEALKPWHKLSDREKQKIIDIILPEIWIPTLVHEIGHNLGLRHNFSGSEDKANFYTTEELAEQGVQQPIPYSSVMDYPYSDLNALPSMGKYDVAALKFAYLRQIETADGQMLPVASTLADLKKQNADLGLKDYGFCTDEHVEVNAGCKRFDEGTNYTERTQHMINAYEESYKRRNFRNGRHNFSLMSDAAALARLEDELNYIRFNFETMSRIKDRFSLDYDSEEWIKSEFLADLKKAAELSANFLLQVLREPEVHCVFLDKSKNAIIGVEAVGKFNPEALHCGQIKTKEPFAIIGSFGKSLHSKKDPEGDNPYADQIDVRGVWLNKVMAAAALLNRHIDNTSWDKTDDNYLDLAQVQAQVLEVFGELFMGAGHSLHKVVLDNGQAVELPLRADYTSGQTIAKPLSEAVVKKLKMPTERDARLQEILLPIIRKSAQRAAGFDQQLHDYFSVLKLHRLSNDLGNQAGVSKFVKGDHMYLATGRNVIAQNLIGQYQIHSLLGGLDDVTIEAALAKLQKGELKDSTQASAAEKAVLQVGEGGTKMYLAGYLSSPEYIEAMLDLLASR